MVKRTTDGARPQDIRERSFQFSLCIIRLYQGLDKQSNAGRILGKQLLRSGTSIGANVEEAQAGQSRADFISKNAIALKEARETIYWLRLLTASGFNGSVGLSDVLSEAEKSPESWEQLLSQPRKGKGKIYKMGKSRLYFLPFTF